MRHTLTDRLYGATDEEFDVVECRGCGLLRLEPQPEPGDLKDYYPNLYWAKGRTRHGLAGLYRRIVLRDHTRFVLKAIRGMGLPRARILDMGCGAGDLLASLRGYGHAGIGLDIAASALQAAAEVGVPGVRADHSAAPFASGSFDVVMLFHLLEHIPNPDAAIREAWRLLADDGRMILQVPNADSWQYALLGRYWSGLDVPRHLYDFGRHDLEEFLSRNRFAVRRWKFFSLRDNPPALATSLAPWLEPMARRVRRPQRNALLRLCADFAYFGLVCACLPFAVAEAVFGRGATMMVEAEKVHESC
jgi:SAM-dependent methyltransferase